MGLPDNQRWLAVPASRLQGGRQQTGRAPALAGLLVVLRVAAAANAAVPEVDEPPRQLLRQGRRHVGAGIQATAGQDGSVQLTGRFAVGGADPQAMAHAFFAAQGLAEGLSQGCVTTNARGHVVAFTQAHRGVPIEGAYATALVVGNTVRFAQYRLVRPDLSVKVHPTITANEAALAIAAAARAGEALAEAPPVLVIAYRPSDRRPTLAWRVPVISRTGASASDYVDAHSSVVIGRKLTSFRAGL